MNFGEALERLKAGHRVARAGWNGRGMWLGYMPPMVVPQAQISPRTKRLVGALGDLDVGGYVAMWTAQSVWQPGWLASQADLLADDWTDLDDEEASR